MLLFLVHNDSSSHLWSQALLVVVSLLYPYVVDAIPQLPPSRTPVSDAWYCPVRHHKVNQEE